MTDRTDMFDVQRVSMLLLRIALFVAVVDVTMIEQNCLYSTNMFYFIVVYITVVYIFLEKIIKDSVSSLDINFNITLL